MLPYLAMAQKRNSSLKPASDLIHTILTQSKSPLADQFQRWRLWRDWQEVVGATWADATLPVDFYKRTLLVWVKSSSWMQELTFFEQALKEKVNDYLGYHWISRIRFTLDRKSVPNPNECPWKELL